MNKDLTDNRRFIYVCGCEIYSIEPDPDKPKPKIEIYQFLSAETRVLQSLLFTVLICRLEPVYQLVRILLRHIELNRYISDRVQFHDQIV